MKSQMGSYYQNKLGVLGDIFGSPDVLLEKDCLVVVGRRYPILDDVIILLNEAEYPESLKVRLSLEGASDSGTTIAKDIQFSFGVQWQTFSELLPEHANEFKKYFDIVDIEGLRNSRVCDLGCGIGRWSYFIKDRCRELVLIDFSEAIFVARRNLKDAQNALFFMADLRQIPFRSEFADFLFCLGVLHHLPTAALDELAVLKRYAPVLLIYLYYALDNRPLYFHILLGAHNIVRRYLSRVHHVAFRNFVSWLIMCLLYMPFILLGALLRPVRLSHFVPLYEAYHDKSPRRIRQDAYDRFFTSIEQRFTKRDILALRKEFSEVIVSAEAPFWHFLCKKTSSAGG